MATARDGIEICWSRRARSLRSVIDRFATGGNLLPTGLNARREPARANVGFTAGTLAITVFVATNAMETRDAGSFEREMEVLSALAEQLKDQGLPLDQLAPLVEKALAQAAVCDGLLREEEGRVAAVLKKHHEMLIRLRVARPYLP